MREHKLQRGFDVHGSVKIDRAKSVRVFQTVPAPMD
jgi:hypothetical protein